MSERITTEEALIIFAQCALTRETLLAADLCDARAEIERLRVSEEQARSAVLKTGRDPKWAAIYARLDNNKDERVKKISDLNGQLEVNVGVLAAERDRLAARVAELQASGAEILVLALRRERDEARDNGRSLTAGIGRLVAQRDEARAACAAKDAVLILAVRDYEHRYAGTGAPLVCGWCRGIVAFASGATHVDHDKNCFTVKRNNALSLDAGRGHAAVATAADRLERYAADSGETWCGPAEALFTAVRQWRRHV